MHLHYSSGDVAEVEIDTRHCDCDASASAFLSEPSRMEAVFKTPELVDLILGYFRVVPSNDSSGPRERIHVSREDLQVTSDDEKRRTLYSMALTNRAISHTALRILWITIDGILPLLKLVSGLKYNKLVGQWVSVP